MNLSALFDLADLGRHVGCDLWNGVEGKRLRLAFLWLVENGFDGPWPFGQQVPFARERWIPLLRRAALRFGDQSCRQRLDSMDGEAVQSDWSSLFYPLPDA